MTSTGWRVIIFNHGYIPPDQYKTTERYVAYVDAIARSGYIVFKSDYRGHGDSEGFASGGYGSPAYTIDVLNALASMKHYPDADPNRIGMWGHSMGGQVTLRSMVVSQDIKAGVIWAGVVGSYNDLLSNLHQPSAQNSPPPSFPFGARRWRNDLTEEYGTPTENPDFWASISPNSYVADLSGPLQLHHDLADHEVQALNPVATTGVRHQRADAFVTCGVGGPAHRLTSGAAAAPARRFGDVSPPRAQHVRGGVGDAVARVVDGGPGRVGVESTIGDLCGRVPAGLRAGAITPSQLSSALGTPVIAREKRT